MSWAGVPVSAVIVLTYLKEMQACLAAWGAKRQRKLLPVVPCREWVSAWGVM